MSSKIDTTVLDSVFQAYDIRGLTPSQLNDNFFYNLGLAFVNFLNANKIVVGRDIRGDSEAFKQAFIKGATEAGADVVDLGEVATEMVYYATGNDTSFDGGAVITASHNPQGWNGCKMVSKGATALSKDSGLTQIKEIIANESYVKAEKPGSVTTKDIYPEFKAKILSLMDLDKLKPFKLVVDAGNGIGGKMFDYIFGDLGMEVEKMYFEPDGNFPNHVPDPLKEENVVEIKAKMATGKFDLGIAIDGDADRVFFIDNQGRNPSGIYTGTVFSKYFLEKNPGAKIIQDPRVVGPIRTEVKNAGGSSIVSKAGHSFFKEKMKAEDAVYGAEMSSHFFYRDFYYADSGMTTIAIMLDYISKGFDFAKELDYLYETYPVSGEINFQVGDVAETIAKVEAAMVGGQIDRTDGVGIEYPEWRFNLRGSNTQPLIRLNMEGKTKQIIIEKFFELEKLIAGKRDNDPSLKELADAIKQQS